MLPRYIWVICNKSIFYCWRCWHLEGIIQNINCCCRFFVRHGKTVVYKFNSCGFSATRCHANGTFINDSKLFVNSYPWNQLLYSVSYDDIITRRVWVNCWQRCRSLVNIAERGHANRDQQVDFIISNDKKWHYRLAPGLVKVISGICIVINFCINFRLIIWKKK